jgi:hypothetical protein
VVVVGTGSRPRCHATQRAVTLGTRREMEAAEARMSIDTTLVIIGGALVVHTFVMSLTDRGPIAWVVGKLTAGGSRT